MFNKNFYPTPAHIAEYMIKDLDLKGKIVLEPSAGKGDLIETLKTKGAKAVWACELDLDLAHIAMAKSDIFLNYDFFNVKSEDISHIDFIVMNPPFYNADRHILHAYEIAAPGCQIVALCNVETIKNPYTETRKRLEKLIDLHGESEEIGDVFIDAERKTPVNISMVTLRKPGQQDTEFADYLFSDEEEAELNGDGGLVKYSFVRDIVGRYIQGVKMFDNFMSETSKINSVIKPLGGNFSLQFNAIEVRDNGYSALDRDTFKKNLQKSAWKAIFNELKMHKYLTKSALEEVNKFVELQTSKPFTMKNIFAMVEIIIGTHAQRMDKVIAGIFDWLTEHHHDNRMNVEGWKTNSMYMVNRKFIAPYCGMRIGWSGQPEVSWNDYGQRMDELCKALCHVTGTNYETCISLHDFFRGIEKNPGKYPREYEYKEWGTWYDWNFFEIKVFKKGTFHAKFKDPKVWEKFNLVAVKAKGWQLPQKTTSDFRQKANGVEVYQTNIF